MKLQKLLKKLSGYLHEGEQKKLEKADGLAKVLKKLKQKELKLQQDLEKEKDKEEYKLLEQELMIVHGQREKGIALLSGVRGRGADKSS